MTIPNMPDSFILDSGLREDMVLTIHGAYFAPHADYQDGKVLMLQLQGIDEDGNPVDTRLSVGADWQTDDGNIITHPTKKAQHINKNSIYGRWLSHSFEIPELAKVLIERASQLSGTEIGPRDARIWIDLVLHLQIRTLEFGRNIDPQQRLMPTEYLGLADNAPAGPAPGSASAAAPTPSPMDLIAAAKANKAAEAALSNGSPTHAKAVQMAKDAPDFSTFIAMALADDDILADDELAVQCADESLIWASAH